ncbi:MAG: hypothetical protein EOO47_12350 [Flavobacterium sp.]|nr:MAG: hypothetical protein EOO47_12350 [Flavobacterium sp.]
MKKTIAIALLLLSFSSILNAQTVIPVKTTEKVYYIYKREASKYKQPIDIPTAHIVLPVDGIKHKDLISFLNDSLTRSKNGLYSIVADDLIQHGYLVKKYGADSLITKFIFDEEINKANVLHNKTVGPYDQYGILEIDAIWSKYTLPRAEIADKLQKVYDKRTGSKSENLTYYFIDKIISTKPVKFD